MHIKEMTTCVSVTTSKDGSTIWLRQHDSLQALTLEEAQQVIKAWDKSVDMAINDHRVKRTGTLYWLSDEDTGMNSIVFSTASYRSVTGVLKLAILDCHAKKGT